MKHLTTTTFLIALVIAAVFIYVSSRWMPSLVASHFGGTGAANGFMSRPGYVRFMLAAAVGLPLLVAFAPWLIRAVSPRLLNVPNREYWLAPERAAETYAYLDGQTLRFGALLAAFLCFVHGLVVRANRLQPPQLSNEVFMVGLMVFFVCVVLWTRALLLRFRRP